MSKDCRLKTVRPLVLDRGCTCDNPECKGGTPLRPGNAAVEIVGEVVGYAEKQRDRVKMYCLVCGRRWLESWIGERERQKLDDFDMHLETLKFQYDLIGEWIEARLPELMMQMLEGT